MTDVTIYTTATCPYCIRAKALLSSKGIGFTEIDVGRDSDLRSEMTHRSGGRRTVPQIFVDGRHVGDCDELMRLARSGELDRILGLGAVG